MTPGDLARVADIRATDVTLAQIVAALSVTYKPAGVMIWLTRNRELITDGRLGEAADKVRRIGDADPSEFMVTEVDRLAAETERADKAEAAVSDAH